MESIVPSFRRRRRVARARLSPSPRNVRCISRPRDSLTNTDRHVSRRGGLPVVVRFLDRSRIVASPGWSRWLVPLAALSIHLAIGQAYAWSVVKEPLEASLGISGVASALPFTLGIVMLGASAA